MVKKLKNNLICNGCGFESPSLDENGLCCLCLETPIEKLDEENLLYVTRNTDTYYTESYYGL